MDNGPWIMDNVVVSLLPQQIRKAIEEFSKLPGIGPKSAERLTFHLLRSSRASPEGLGKALMELKAKLRYCDECQMVTLQDRCSICTDTSRDHCVILVVENPLDVIAFEKTAFKGVYHVLHGVLSPIDGMGPEQLRLKELMDRCSSGNVAEVILAMNPDVEGEATAAYIKQKLEGIVTLRRSADACVRVGEGCPERAERVEGHSASGWLRVKRGGSAPACLTTITRLAHGLPMGADIEFADQVTLKEALEGRRDM